MRQTVLFPILISLLAAVAPAQQSTRSDRAPVIPVDAVQSYVVQVTEFRLNGSSEPGLSAKEILRSLEQLRKDGKVEMIETVRLSTLEQNESMVQFGRSAAVPVGTTSAGPGRGTTRTTQARQTGTLVRLTARPQAGKILLKLSYEASRFEGKGTEQSPPDTLTVQFNTTLLIEPGQPTLIGSASSNKTSVLVVSIDK